MCNDECNDCGNECKGKIKEDEVSMQQCLRCGAWWGIKPTIMTVRELKEKAIESGAPDDAFGEVPEEELDQEVAVLFPPTSCEECEDTNAIRT